MEKIKILTVNRKRKYQQIGIPVQWFRRYVGRKDELALFQDGDKLIIAPEKHDKEEILNSDSAG